MTAPEKVYISKAASKSSMGHFDTQRFTESDITYVREDLTGWRPIETALKDGSLIDGFSNTSFFPKRIPDIKFIDGAWHQYLEYDDWYPLAAPITHWMPLPEPPRSES